MDNQRKDALLLWTIYRLYFLSLIEFVWIPRKFVPNLFYWLLLTCPSWTILTCFIDLRRASLTINIETRQVVLVKLIDQQPSIVFQVNVILAIPTPGSLFAAQQAHLVGSNQSSNQPFDVSLCCLSHQLIEGIQSNHFPYLKWAVCPIAHSDNSHWGWSFMKGALLSSHTSSMTTTDAISGSSRGSIRA